MHASTLSSHGFSRNWLRPEGRPAARATQPGEARPREAAHSLAGELLSIVLPGLLGVAALAVLLLVMR